MKFYFSNVRRSYSNIKANITFLFLTSKFLVKSCAKKSHSSVHGKNSHGRISVNNVKSSKVKSGEHIINVPAVTKRFKMGVVEMSIYSPRRGLSVDPLMRRWWRSSSQMLHFWRINWITNGLRSPCYVPASLIAESLLDKITNLCGLAYNIRLQYS